MVARFWEFDRNQPKTIKLPWTTMETNQDHESREPPVKNEYKQKTVKISETFFEKMETNQNH